MKKNIFCLALFAILLVINSVSATSYIYTEEKIEEESSISTASTAPTFNFQSKSQILIELTTGNIIYENNADERILPASVTKVMTMLLTMEAIDEGRLKYDDIITCSANASKMGGSQIWFKEGETLTVDEALKAIAVVSANDVTLAMAEHIAGSETNFVSMMNEKAKSLGMTGTNFVDCHGLDEENHYTTARDISIMSRELILKHPDILKYTSIWMDTLRNGTFALSSTNKLIRFYDGATGLKTGYTSNAGYNLSASATRNGQSFIAVICKAPSSDVRNEEAKQLLDFAFNNFEIAAVSDKETPISKIKVEKSIGKEYDVYTDTLTILKQKGAKIEYDTVIELQTVKAPLEANAKVGTVKYIEKNNPDNTLAEGEIKIRENISKSNFMDYYTNMLNKFANIA